MNIAGVESPCKFYNSRGSPKTHRICLNGSSKQISLPWTSGNINRDVNFSRMNCTYT